MSEELTISNDIKNKIYTVRGKQVMLDSDLAKLYEVSTGHLNRAVKRNEERFPLDFCFSLTKEEFENLKCQNGIARSDKRIEWGGRRNFPLAFTEHGAANLSSVLRSQKAIKINVEIMRAFIAMRKFLSENKDLIQDMYFVKSKVLDHDKNFEKIFKALESKELPEKGIFFDGQVFDAFVFISKLIKKAEKEIVLIDNYVDENTLNLFSDKKVDVKVTIYTRNISEKLNLAVNKFNNQYGNLKLKSFNKSHDRFLIINDSIYHVGASLKDLGKKWFGFSRLNLDKDLILSRLKL